MDDDGGHGQMNIEHGYGSLTMTMPRVKFTRVEGPCLGDYVAKI